MILTEAAAVEEADSLRVVFKDGGTAAGTLKQKDSLGGLAVVSVAEARGAGSRQGSVSKPWSWEIRIVWKLETW